MQKLLILLFLVLKIAANPNWKQVSGTGEMSDDFFSRNPTADVIWGYDKGLWHVACRKHCPELAKYPDLKQMVHQQGYWVRNLHDMDAIIQSPLTGIWDMQMFSTGPFDAVTATLTISYDGSATMTGHAMLLAQLGLNQYKRPISAFEINRIEIVHESILAMHYTFFEEAVKPKDIPEDYIVNNGWDVTIDRDKFNQYLAMGYIEISKTAPACRFGMPYLGTQSAAVILKNPGYTPLPAVSSRTKLRNQINSFVSPDGGNLASGFATELLSAEVFGTTGMTPNISCDIQMNHYQFLPVPGKMYHPIIRRTLDSITLQLQTHKNYWVDQEPRHGSDLLVLTRRTTSDADLKMVFE